MTLRDLWNETLAEPVPQRLLDVLEGAADEWGDGSEGGPNGSTPPRESGSK